MAALKISTMIFVIVVLVTSIINIIFYQQAAQGVCTGISSGFAIFMMWVNIVFVILAGGIFIWTMFRLFRKKPEKADEKEMKDKKESKKSPSKKSSGYQSPRVRDEREERVRSQASSEMGREMFFE